MNYSELLIAIQNYMEDRSSKFQEALPTVVAQAEERIYRMSPMLPCYERSVEGLNWRPTPPQFNFIDYPDGMLVIDYVACWPRITGVSYPRHDINPLEKRTKAWVRDRYGADWVGGTTNVPVNYYTENYKIYPVPISSQASYSMYIRGRGRLDKLGPERQTNWIAENAETVLLNACLAEACSVLRKDPSLYLTNLAQGLQALTAEGDATTKPGDMYI